jgi:protease-4
MALESDWLVDRRRLKRRLVVWRTLAILVAVGLVAAAIGRFGIAGIGGLVEGPYIARLDVDNIITDDTKRIRALKDLAKDSSAKALIVRINSPGGTVVGGETLYKALRKVAAKMPVVAEMGDLATSAGYMTAIAADHIVAHDGTITGSIGVLLQTAEFTELLQKVGVSVDTIKSGPLKAQPSPFEKLTPQVRQATQALVNDMFQMFKDMVQERRHMTAEQVRALADGRVFTGRMAVKNGLVDEIGGESEVLAWLAKARGVNRDLPIRPVRPRREVDQLLDYVDSMARKMTMVERLTLDGLVSVWHPRLQ